MPHSPDCTSPVRTVMGILKNSLSMKFSHGPISLHRWVNYDMAKSQILVKCLEDLTERNADPHHSIDAKIIDGAVVVQTFSLAHAGTFQDYAHKVFLLFV